jgi:hypothetical protein
VVDLGGSHVYDGSTAGNAGDLVLGTLVGSETLTLSGTGSMADKNVGNGKIFALGTLTLSDGTGNAANYILAGGNDTVDISKRAIMVDATGADKVYDGTTADTVSLASTGLLVGDTVNFTGTGSFTDKNVGTAKAVGVSGIAASGADAGNYSFNTTAHTTANITARAITVDATGTNRVYDGTTTDAVNLASSGILTGDRVNFTGTGNFADKHVGTSKTVSVIGIAANGSDAGNYSYNTTTATTADVTPATLTYRADAASFWTGQMPGGLSGAVTGLVSGESLGEATDGTLTWTTLADSASPAGLYAIDGGGLSALNYLFEQAPGNATALRVANGSASHVVTTIVAGLQQDETSQDDDANAPYAPDVRVVNGGVRLP